MAFSKIASFIIFALLALSGCQQKASSEHLIKVGTIEGPETQLMIVAKEVALKKHGLEIQIVPFTDYTMPNEALANGSIDANMMQHAPYLKQAMLAKGYDLAIAAKTFIYPMGIYSHKIKKLSEVPTNATVALPNDPSNEARALLLLEKAGLITLKPTTTTQATTPNDIVKNTKQLKFKELDAAQLPRALEDVDIAVINTNYAMVANLMPSKDALFIESPDSPYANLLVVKRENLNSPKVKELIEALHSDAVLHEAKILFKNQVIPAWK